MTKHVGGRVPAGTERCNLRTTSPVMWRRWSRRLATLARATGGNAVAELALVAPVRPTLMVGTYRREQHGAYRMSQNMKSLVGRFCSDQRGIVGVMTAFVITAYVGVGAVVVEVAYLEHTRTALWSSTDAAVLAGARDMSVGSGGTAITTATSHSAMTVKKNADRNLTAALVSGYP